MTFESDWEFLQAALPDLREYVLSNDLYWPLRLPARSPQLTIGSLRLSLARLHGLSLTQEQRTGLAEMEKSVGQVCGEWRTNWSRKAGREFASRLNLLRQYISELRSDPRANASAYPTQARNRAILQLLTGEMLDGVPQQEADQLNGLDDLVRALTLPGPFLWEAEVQSAFPHTDYWFLYVTIRK